MANGRLDRASSHPRVGWLADPEGRTAAELIILVNGSCRLLSVLLVCSALPVASCGSPQEKKLGKLPFGVMDGPRAGATFRGVALLSGWALSESGIQRVSVYIDRIYVMPAQIGGGRRDVAKAFPDIAVDERSGWSASLDSAALTPGVDEIVVQATANDGATRDLASINVNVAQP